MPILDDIRDHDLLGPVIRRARQEEGKTIVVRQIEKRFGTVPAWARQRLEAMSTADIEEVALSLLDAHNLEELLGA
jgi:hypothetical protein